MPLGVFDANILNPLGLLPTHSEVLQIFLYIFLETGPVTRKRGSAIARKENNFTHFYCLHYLPRT